MQNVRRRVILRIVFMTALFIGRSNTVAQQTQPAPQSQANGAEAASPSQSPNARPTPAYKTLRYEEDWSFLRDKSKRTDFFDPVKYIPLRRDREDWYLSIGGEVRPYPERFSNDGFGTIPGGNGYLGSGSLTRESH